MEHDELSALRARIDEIDGKVTGLFSDRMDAALKIAEYKKKNNLPAMDRTRERDVLSRLSGLVGDDLAGYLKVLYATVFDLSRSYQNRLLAGPGELAARIADAVENTPKQFPYKAVVACQGIEGAYSQLACDKLFALPSILYFNRFGDVFHAVEKGLCRYGILPIENSSIGSVTQVYDLMKQYSFHIAKSIRLRVNHVLLAKPGCALSDIREVFSHEQAIGQCGEFLKDLSGVKTTVCENTAVAARMVMESERRDVAAISSSNCAELYGLNVLRQDIQNENSNYTRFICISKKMEIYPGANKISLMLSIEHRPGSLYEVIAKFAALGLNLTKLESRPVPGRDFEFTFYFDFDASIYAPEVISLLCDLDNTLPQFDFLGSYLEQ